MTSDDVPANMPDVSHDESRSEAQRSEANRRGVNPARTTAWVLLPLSILLAPLSAALLYMVHRTESHEPFHTWNLLWTALDIGAEGNVATWFASTMWLFVGGFAALAALTAPRLRKRWWFFAAIGVIASADEASALHERLFVVGDRLAPYLPFDTFYNWVIPGTLIALIVGVLLIRLVLTLHLRVIVTLIGSGVLFLLGAILIETLTGLVHRQAGEMNALYLALMYLEETFELIAVALAVIALSSMFRVVRSANGLSVQFHGYREVESSPASR